MVHSPQLKQLGALIDSLRKDPDSHLLVAGGKPALFTEDIRNLPRVTFWHSTEQSAKQNCAPVPTRTRAIVFNRWVDHALTANLRREAKRFDIPMCNIPLGTGVILDLIKEAGLMGGETPSMISDAPIAMGRGRLRSFILQEGDLSAPVGTEIPRLFALAQERGLPTTLASVSTTFYQVRANKIGMVRVRRMDSEAHPVPTPICVPEDALMEPFLKPAEDSVDLLALVVDLNREVRHAQEQRPTEAELKLLPTEADLQALPAPPKPDYIVPMEYHDASPVEVFRLASEGKAWINPAKPIMETGQVLSLITDAIANLQKLTGDAVSALQLVHEAITSVEPTLAEAAKLQAKIDKMKAFLNE